jgi:hypothetical protein
MKTLTRLAAAALASIALCSAADASAIDLRNEDERAYPMTVTSSEMTRELSVRPLTLSFYICVGTCEFKVEGVGTVKASGQDVITIRGGRFVTEKAQAEAR